MNKHKAKLEGLKRRQRRVRGKVSGTAERPRLRVTRTNANIYAQIIDDSKGSSLTLVSASTLEAEFKGTHTSNKEAAEKVGQLVGKRAIEAGITKVAFRSWWPYLPWPRQGPRRRCSCRRSRVLGGM